jgi:hypothetical protein
VLRAPFEAAATSAGLGAPKPVAPRRFAQHLGALLLVLSAATVAAALAIAAARTLRAASGPDRACRVTWSDGR